MNNPLVIPMTVSESTTSFDMSMDMAINVSGDIDIRPLSVTENGVYREDGKAYTPVTVNVPQPSGSISITENGSVDVTDYETANVSVRQPSGTKQISITQNGTTTEDIEWYEDAELTVNVPNTYTASDEGKVVSSGALVGQTSRNITANGTVDTTLNNEVVVAVPNSYTQADEGKVVSSGALVSQTSRTVSDNGTYDTTLNNEVVVNNEDYSESLVAFGVEDDLADGIEAMTTYSNEITGESDTTLSDAVRTLADGYGGGGEVATGYFFGNGGLAVSIPCDFDPDMIYIFSPNRLDDFPITSGSASWALYWTKTNCVVMRKTTTSLTASAGYVIPTSNNKPGKIYANGVVTVNLPGSSAYQFIRGAKYEYYFAKMQIASRLPDGYQEVSCLICDGGQYIDTGFYPNTTKTKVEIGVYPTSNDVIQGLCGARNGTAFEVNSCNIFKMNGNLRLDWVDASAIKTVTANLNTYFDVSCTRGRAEVNTTVVTASVTDSVDVNHTFYVGNINSAGSPYENGFIGSIYYTRLYDEGTLVRNLVPCYRKTDSVIGMYDLVNDTFYTNAGTGAFGKGGYIGGPSRLPDEYEEATYIRSNGTQYIDTGFIGNQDTRTIIKYQSADNVAGQFIFGARTESNSNAYFISADNTDFYFGYDGNSTYTRSVNTNVHTVDLNKNVLVFDGATVQTFTKQNFTTPNNLLLFGSYNGGSVVIGKTTSIYSCSIYDNDTLVRDFVPCYRKADFKAGMYDIVNNVFYDNAGTGDFAVG